MGKDRVRVKGASKGKRWVKGKSSSSNPESRKHRNAAKGKFGSHLISSSKGLPLTSQALALHDSATRRQPSAELAEHSEFEGESLGTTSTAITTSSVYSLVETAHPVFGSVRRLWKDPSVKHQNVLATLAAISEVIKLKDGEEIETEYFCLLVCLFIYCVFATHVIFVAAFSCQHWSLLKMRKPPFLWHICWN